MRFYIIKYSYGFPIAKWFQVFLSNTYNSIYNKSFVWIQ